MNVKMKELIGKLEKSQRRSMMITALCGDDKFISKILGEEQAKVYDLLDYWAEVLSEEEIDDEGRGDIANDAIVSLVSASKGKDSVERAKNFLESFAGLLFESKDTLELTDYCNAVARLRLIGKDVLPKGMWRDPEDSRSDENVSSKTKAFKGRRVTLQWHLVLKAANAAVKNNDTEEGKKAFDEKEAEQAKRVFDFVSNDLKMKELVCSFGKQFSDWIVEQVFGLKPEVVETIGTVPGDDHQKTIKLFGQFIHWMKDNDPNGYIKYLAESTDDEKKAQDDNNSKEEGNPKVTVNVNAKEDQGTPLQVEDKESKYFGMSPWEVYQARKNDPVFTSNCWVGVLL